MHDTILFDIFLSTLRWLIGLCIGSCVGFLIASLGRLRFLNKKYFNSFLDFFRALPIIGLVPIIQMNFGINEYGKIGLIAWGVMFLVWLSVTKAYNKELPDAVLMLKASNVSKTEFKKIYTIPRIMGGLINGIDIGIGIAWLCVVAAELIGTYSQGFWSGGLGYRLFDEYQNNNWLEVHIILAIFGFLGISSALLWRKCVTISIKKTKGFNPLK